MLLGSTEIEAVGVGGGGGGGGGGGVFFFPHAPIIKAVLRATINTSHLILDCFTFIPPATQSSFLGPDEVIYYFQLQFGCVLRPVNVNCWTLEPSASMPQICRLPERFDWNTMCRPSGDQDGKSLRPPSCVSCTHCLLAISIRYKSDAPGSPGPYLRTHANVRNCPFGAQFGDTAYP